MAATTLGTSAVADDERGTASGLLNTAAQVGTAVGIAALVLIGDRLGFAAAGALAAVGSAALLIAADRAEVPTRDGLVDPGAVRFVSLTMDIILSHFMSLDGVVQAPGGPQEDTDGGFAHGGWSMQYFDPRGDGPGDRRRAAAIGRAALRAPHVAGDGRARGPNAAVTRSRTT